MKHFSIFYIFTFILITLVGCKSSNNGSGPDNNEGCTDVEDCNGDCGGSAVVDECGICGGNGNCTSVPIYYNFSSPIAGFQFKVEGVDITGAGGGAAEAADFYISSNSTSVIGFSLSGSTIPIGSGVLVMLDVTVSGDACILKNDFFTISSPEGTNLDANVIGCNTIHIP